MKYIFIPLFFLFVNTIVYSQTGKLVAGPMQGHITTNTAKFFLLVEKADTVIIQLTKSIASQTKQIIKVCTDTLKSHKGYFSIVKEFVDLSPDTEYELTVWIDNILINKKVSVRTLKESPVENFSFLTGSCALQVSPFFKPFFRVGSDRIFKNMLNVQADFMIWLGDNTYYIKRQFASDDYASAEGMWRRQIKTRKIKRMDDFLTATPQYAIWDDHDYGSYDGDERFPLKDTSLNIFKSIWANPSYALPGVKGIFTTFRKYDAEFILLDDRYYRSAPNTPNGTMLGKQQLNWFFETLKKSDATFKFIILGSQMLNPYNNDECYSVYPDEKKEILNFIESNAIKGVIFITGDAHYADLEKLNRKNTYPIYDFTCSPLTSFLHSPSDQEIANTERVPQTLTHQRNFGKISVTGQKGNRICTIELFDDRAKLLWKHDIPEQELK